MFVLLRADIWNLLSAAKWDAASKYAPFFCELPSQVRFPIVSQTHNTIVYESSSGDVAMAENKNWVLRDSYPYGRSGVGGGGELFGEALLSASKKNQSSTSTTVFSDVGKKQETHERRVRDVNQVLSVSFDHEILESDHYSFLLVRCEPSEMIETFTVNIEMLTVNPNGQHLSTQTVPLVLVFYVLSVMYGVLTLYWVGLNMMNV